MYISWISFPNLCCSIRNLYKTDLKNLNCYFFLCIRKNIPSYVVTAEASNNYRNFFSFVFIRPKNLLFDEKHSILLTLITKGKQHISCTICTVQYKLSQFSRAVEKVQQTSCVRTLYTLPTTGCTLNTLQCIMNTVQCILNTVPCTMRYTVQLHTWKDGVQCSTISYTDNATIGSNACVSLTLIPSNPRY